jgi:peroxiredoxin
MPGGLVFVGTLAVFNLLLILLVARRVRRLAERPMAPMPRPWLAPGTKVPDFEAVSVGGERLSLDSLRGRRSLVGFFSTSCEPCQEQLPVFARQAAADGGPRQVLAVVVGTAEEAEEFVALLTGKAMVVREDQRGPTVTAFSAHAFPGIYLLDPEAKVIASGASVAAVAGAHNGAAVARR